MISYKEKIAEILAPHIDGLEKEVIMPMIETPADSSMGDYAFPCFKLAKILRKAPPMIAKGIADAIAEDAAFDKVEQVNAYVNMFISKTEFAESVVSEAVAKGDDYGKSDIGAGRKVIVEYSSPNMVPIRDNKKITCWLYTIGVDAGKATIMANLKVQEPGPKYCHFNRHPDAGYDLNFFNGLLSEKMVLTRTRRGDRWAWEKLPGHNRNEALDCRDYANAGLKIINPDMDAIERRLQGLEEQPKAQPQRRQRARRSRADTYDDW